MKKSNTGSFRVDDPIIIKSDSPKAAEWVKRLKAHKQMVLEDMHERIRKGELKEIEIEF